MREKNKAIDTLKEFCSQPSVSATGEGIDEMASLLRNTFEQFGLKTELIETEGAPVVFGSVRGSSDKTLLFYNHYDVQPPDPLEEWDSPPFEPEIRNGKLFARGVSDNKGNIAARLWAVKTLLDDEGELPVNVKFVVEGEEEIGSPHFEEFVDLHKQKIGAKGCIWESGYLNEEDRLQICLGWKGILYVELLARGANRDLHSSLGTIVPNAAWKLVKALDTMKDEDDNVQIKGFYEHVREPTPSEIQALEAIPFKEEQKKEQWNIPRFINNLSGLALKRKHILEPACNICGLKAGWIKEGSKTVLPSKALAKVGFRLVPDQDPTTIKRKLRTHLDTHGFEDISITAADGEKPARTPLDHPFVGKVVDAASSVYDKDPVVYPSSAGSGPIYAIRKLDIPVAGAGVGYFDSNNHAPNENIRLQDYMLGIKHVIQLLKTF